MVSLPDERLPKQPGILVRLRVHFDHARPPDVYPRDDLVQCLLAQSVRQG